MISNRTIKTTKNSVNNSFIEKYGISKMQFDKMMKEAQYDIENGNLHTHAEVMNSGLELLESRMSELSEKEQIEARKFIHNWRNNIIEQV